MAPLPSKALDVIKKLEATPALVLHLKLVHDTALQLLKSLNANWPELSVDTDLVSLGAATHDIGKCQIPEELNHPGKKHEELGEQLLLQYGFSRKEARFARSHGSIEFASLELEDLLVVAADKLWKGQRVEDLEECITQRISSKLQRDYWEVYPSATKQFDTISEGSAMRLALTRR